LGIVSVAASSDTKNSPAAYLEGKCGDTPSWASPVVCLGDSLTCGNMSADWVGTLRDKLASRRGSTTVLNAGRNMHCARNLLNRLDEVIACRPSHVTVLVGTNDLKGELSPMEGKTYELCNGLERPPTLEDYERDLREIRDRLLAAGACVALVSPPVLGEDPMSAANLRAAAYAATVKRVAREGGSFCAYLPLFEKTSQALPAEGGRPYSGPQAFAWMCMLCVDLYVRRRSFEDVMQERGLGVTCDLVHLGSEAAEQMAAMAESFVVSMPGRPPSALEEAEEGARGIEAPNAFWARRLYGLEPQPSAAPLSR